MAASISSLLAYWHAAMLPSGHRSMLTHRSRPYVAWNTATGFRLLPATEETQ
jgi:hypothetical protein